MRKLCVLLLIIALLSLSGLSEAAEVVRFAYPAKSLNYLPLFLGKAKGLYEGEGIDLNLVQVSSILSAKALTTGDLEFSGSDAQVMGAAAKGLPLKVVAYITVKPSFWLMSKPEIHSIPDLKGKRVGTTAIGSSTDLLARYILKKNGLVPDKEVTLFATGTTGNILTAMKAGVVDAGMLSPPFHAMAKNLGFRILTYLGDHVETSLSAIGTSDKLIREKPEMVKKVIRAALKAIRFVRQNRAETIQYIAKDWKVDPPLAEELYLSMVPAFSADGSMGEKAIRETLEREKEQLQIKEEVPLTRVVDLRLLKQVQKEF